MTHGTHGLQPKPPPADQRLQTEDPTLHIRAGGGGGAAAQESIVHRLHGTSKPLHALWAISSLGERAPLNSSGNPLNPDSDKLGIPKL